MIIGGTQGAKLFDSELKKTIIDISKKYKLNVYQQTNLTNSKNAQDILQNWNQSIQNFVRIIPHAYKRLLSKK